MLSTKSNDLVTDAKPNTTSSSNSLWVFDIDQNFFAEVQSNLFVAFFKTVHALRVMRDYA